MLLGGGVEKARQYRQAGSRWSEKFKVYHWAVLECQVIQRGDFDRE